MQEIDKGQLWVPLDALRRMTLLPNQATIIVAGRGVSGRADLPSWQFRDQDYLLQDIHELVKGKRGPSTASLP